MASLHTIQVYGLDDDESLNVNSFNICENTTATGNNTSTGELNYINSHKSLFIVIIWSAVIVALFHLIIEAKYATRNEQVFFGNFIFIHFDRDLAPDPRGEDLEMQEENIQQRNEPEPKEVSSDPEDRDQEENINARTETEENEDK